MDMAGGPVDCRPRGGAEQHAGVLCSAWARFCWLHETPHSQPPLPPQAYQEAVIVNMLEVFLYHDYAAEALGDGVVDLIDFAMRKVTYLIRLCVASLAARHHPPNTHTRRLRLAQRCEGWVE